jgi:site-specific recombinase XerD
MILSQAVEQYILHKRSLGIGFRSEVVRLRAFIQAIGDCEMNLVEPTQVLCFLEGNGPLTTFWFSKYHTLKAFYRYALARDYCTSSPLPLSVPQKPEAFQPYIYTDQDIERLIDAADSRHRYRWLLEPHTVRTLLLLLYGTGLRIGEALHLTLADFDTGTGVLTIRETKFFKSRFVPVGNDLRGVLCRYIDRQWPESLRSETTPLLGTVKGAPITRQTAELVFKRLREQAGVSRSDDATFQPRLHDFRHTFAVVRLVTWYREGKNVQRLLPHLSIYLGHGVLRDTQRYPVSR